MRFFKIFLVAFLSLIGVIGAILGIMYISGSFSRNIIAPEEIHFEFLEGDVEFNMSTDTHIKIGSKTENVTLKRITLSLPNEIADRENGITYITDGVIKVPKYVQVGQAFKVELCKEINEEIGNEEWIVGGVSNLTAKSETLKAKQATANVNVDVPVKSISVVTYANETYSDLKTSFASGETFFAKANFLPSNSLYKYGQDGNNGKPVQMKAVYFDAINSGESNSVVENTTVNQELLSQGITNIKAFRTTSATNELAVNAYAFLNSSLQEEYVKNTGNDLDQLLRELKNTNVSTSSTKDIQIQNLVVHSFTINSDSSTRKYLEYNKINKIFANSGSSSASLNLGIKISDSADPTPRMQNKIKNVGLEVFFRNGNQYLQADDSYFLIVDRQGELATPTADGYYVPTVVEADINKSFWNFVPLQANMEYAFGLHILDDNGQKDETLVSVPSVYTYDAHTKQIWQSKNLVESTISWSDTTPVDITIVDSEEVQEIQSEEFDLSTILQTNLGTYKTYRYIAYNEGSTEDLSKVLKSCTLSTKYSTTQLGVPDRTSIYEFTNPIIKLSPTAIKSFKVRAVVLASDYRDRISGNTYSIHTTTEPLVINIEKTVKKISVTIEVSDSTLLKNWQTLPPPHPSIPGVPMSEGFGMSKLAFLLGTNENIFDVVFTLTGENRAALDPEVAIFKAHFGTKINVVPYVMGEQKSVITSVNAEDGTYEDITGGVKWTYKVSYYAGQASRDTDVWLEYSYLHTNTSSSVHAIAQKDVKLIGEAFNNIQFEAPDDRVMIDMYDGKVHDLDFRYMNSKDEPIIQRTEIVVEEDGEGNKKSYTRGNETVYYAKDVVSKYFDKDNNELSDTAGQHPLLDENNNFIVIAKDKQGNTLNNIPYSCEPVSERVSTEVYSYYFLTTSDYSSSCTEAPTDKLYYQTDNGSTTVTVAVNRGSKNNGTWTSSSIIAGGFTALSAQEAQHEITIERYGAVGKDIDLKGDHGLLSVLYEVNPSGNDPTEYYELCNYLKYNIQTNMSQYAGVLKYENDQIKIEQTLGSDIDLLFVVETGIGSRYEVKLVIKRNVTIQVTRETPQGSLPEAEIVNNQYRYLLYSDNDVCFKVRVEAFLSETNLQLHVDNDAKLSTTGDPATRGSSQTVNINFDPNETSGFAELYMWVNFGEAQLGQQTINITTTQITGQTAPSSFAFSESVICQVKPNIGFADGSEELEIHVDLPDYDPVENKITASNFKRWTDENAILSTDNIKIDFDTIADGRPAVYQGTSSTPVANIFGWDDENKTLSRNGTMTGAYNPNGEYTVHMSVKYGSEFIGKIVFKISSGIKPNANEDHAAYTERFAIYNNQEYLVFKAGETGITKTDIAALFENVEDIDFAVDSNFVIANGNGTYSIRADIHEYTVLNTDNVSLTLKHQNGNGNDVYSEIVFPILIVPVETNFVTYSLNEEEKSQTTFGDESSRPLTNISALNDYIKLKNYDVCDVYDSGEVQSLIRGQDKSYGLSVAMHDKLKSNTFMYALFLEGEHGEISRTPYAGTFDVQTGNLTMLPSSRDVYVYFVVYAENNLQKIVALYRIKVQANASINVYYPYASGPCDVEENLMAEYVFESPRSTITLNLNQTFDQTKPNVGHKRVQLDVRNETTGQYEESAHEYSANYSLFKVNNILAANNLGIISIDYGVSLQDGVLTIYNKNTTATRKFDIVLACNVMQGLTDMGTVYYTIRLNTDQKELYSLQSNTSSSIYRDGTSSTATINKSSTDGVTPTSYAYDAWILYKTEGNISGQATDVELNVYYYISNQSNNNQVDEYITEDTEAKTLTLSDQAVSNKRVVFLYYTIYGVLHTDILNFESDYSFELNSNQSLTATSTTNLFEVYADTSINLKDAFIISNASGEIGTTEVPYSYSIDGEDEVEGAELCFPQISSAKERHSVKVIVKTTGMVLGGAALSEDYVFEFEVDVLQSIRSNYPESNPMILAGETKTYVHGGSINLAGNLINKNWNNATSTPYLFESYNESVLDGYTITGEIISGSEYMSFFTDNDNEQTSATVAMSGDIPLYFRTSPSAPQIVTVKFMLEKGENCISSYLTFTLVPDIQVVLTYPQPNTTSSFQIEHIYLPSAGGNFNFATAEAYFNTTRLTFLTNDNIPTAGPQDRVQIQAICLGVASESAIKINNNHYATVALNNANGFALSWVTNSSGEVVSDLSADVEFKVLIDGRERATYLIRFTNNIQNIFAVNQIINLNDNLLENAESNQETFFVDSENSEPIFSHKTAVLTFTSKPQPQPVTLVAYANDNNSPAFGNNGEKELGKITLGTTGQTYQWLLKNATHEINQDLSNIVIRKAGETTNYTFGTAYMEPNHVFNNFFDNDIQVDFRLHLTYYGEQVDYENYSELLEAEVVEEGNNSSIGKVNTAPINRKSAAAGKEIQFKINEATLVRKYYYKVIYDFKADKGYSASNRDAVLTLRAPQSLSNNNVDNLGNETFGISGLESAFDAEYFNEHKIQYFAEVAMITTKHFNNNPTKANVTYLPSGKAYLLNQYFPNLFEDDNTAITSQNFLCVAITPKMTSNNVQYDFNLTAYGAETEGNYVYILITYKASDEQISPINESNYNKFAHALIKVFVEPNTAGILLRNSDGLPNDVNESSHQLIEYEYDQADAEYKIAPITLGTNGASLATDNNLIYILSSSANTALQETNLICDKTGNYQSTLQLCGEIADYMQLETDGQSYFLKQKPGTVATYGAKYGYIRIKDMYGYEKNYYLRLSVPASSADKALSIPESGMFVNLIPGTQNKFYSGTQMTIEDTENNDLFGDIAVVRINNLNNLIQKVNDSTLADKWQFKVTYKIPEIEDLTIVPPAEQVFTKENDEYYQNGTLEKSFTLPSIVEDTKEVTLKIIIKITHIVGSATTDEIVTLQVPISIEKRFKLTDNLDATTSVQSGTEFDVAKFLSVKDEANAATNVGSALMSGNVLTLRIASNPATDDQNITVNATYIHNNTSLNRFGAVITIGKDYNKQAKTAHSVGGTKYYYYILADHPRFDGINFEDYEFSVTGDSTVLTNCTLYADKIVYLTTSDVDSNQEVFVEIDDGETALAMPYHLITNGVQAKSLVQAIQTQTLKTGINHAAIADFTALDGKIDQLALSNVRLPAADDIYKFNLSSTPVSADDVQIVQGFKVYDDSLKLKILKPENIDITKLTYTVTIKDAEDHILGSGEFPITENIEHYRYISVSNLIKDSLTTDNISNTEFNITISYKLSTQGVANIIAYCHNLGDALPICSSAPENEYYTYSINSTFSFSEINNDNLDCINVASAQSFKNKIYTTEKSYVVKFLNQTILETKKLNFNVTPKYYGLNTEGSVTDKKVYANQYHVDCSQTYPQYIVPFDTWASSFDLVSLAGDVLAPLNNGENLSFKINDGQGAGSGSGTISNDNTLTTNSNYRVDQNFVIDIYVEFNPGSNNTEDILIGSVNVRLIHDQVYVTNPGTYNVVITYAGSGSNGSNNNDNLYTINLAYEFAEGQNVTSVDDLIFNNPKVTFDASQADANSRRINIAGQWRYIADCNIEIITVVEQIFSTEYLIKSFQNDGTQNREWLAIKFKLNEKSSSVNKSVTFRVDAKREGVVNTKNVIVEFDEKEGETGFILDVSGVSFSSSSGNPTGTEEEVVGYHFNRQSPGVYILYLPFESVFSTAVIGADNTYITQVEGVTDTNDALLYASSGTLTKDNFTAGQTLFFAVDYFYETQQHYTILAQKYNDEVFKTTGFFTVDISPLTSLDGETVLDANGKKVVSSFNIRYINALDVSSDPSDFIISSKNGSKNMHSIGKVQTDNFKDGNTIVTSNIYEISVNNSEIYANLAKSTSTLQEYTKATKTVATTDESQPVTYYLPKYIPITVENQSTIYVTVSTAVNSQAEQGASELFGITPTATGTIWLNLEGQACMNGLAPCVTATISNSISGTINEEGTAYWQIQEGSTTIKITEITELTPEEDYICYNLGLSSGDLNQRPTLIGIESGSVNLANLSGSSLAANTYYNFKLTKLGETAASNEDVLFFAAKTDENGALNVSLATIFAQVSGGAQAGDKYEFTKLNVSNDSDTIESGSAIYTMFDAQNQVQYWQKVDFEQIEDTNIYVTQDPIVSAATPSALLTSSVNLANLSGMANSQPNTYYNFKLTKLGETAASNEDVLFFAAKTDANGALNVSLATIFEDAFAEQTPSSQATAGKYEFTKLAVDNGAEDFESLSDPYSKNTTIYKIFDGNEKLVFLANVIYINVNDEILVTQNPILLPNTLRAEKMAPGRLQFEIMPNTMTYISIGPGSVAGQNPDDVYGMYFATSEQWTMDHMIGPEFFREHTHVWVQVSTEPIVVTYTQTNSTIYLTFYASTAAQNYKLRCDPAQDGMDEWVLTVNPYYYFAMEQITVTSSINTPITLTIEPEENS